MALLPQRLLIANRGEIVVRIARTAHRLGIDTVGVYSDPDANGLHVDAVDLAVALGGATPAQSYLLADAVVRAAVATGCDAVHPGYGFLAENAAFARQVIEAGLTWIGPTPQQIELLGDKVAAKSAAVAAGVAASTATTVEPGVPPVNISLPAMVKAAYGGGGRGMRIVSTSDELASAIEAASREAGAAFGDGTVFVEPFIENAKHIEVQILGDAHGQVVHLGERECSIQRRNQKVLEEAPAPTISSAIRTKLCESAVALARHVGYQSAGTVEFLVGVDGEVNFLEVNTRLQVEHPVTEAVTGLDLVELQLRVAAGEPLPLKQDEITFNGHAIEARIVAEDPASGWLPDSGEVNRFRIDGEVRVDAGIRSGSVVTPDYDSLLAKVIAHGATRNDAVRSLARALRTAELTGLKTNAATMNAILEEQDFLTGATTVAYLEKHPEVLQPAGPDGDDRLALLLGAVFETEWQDRKLDPVTTFAPSGWRNLRIRGQRQVWHEAGRTHHVEYVFREPGSVQVWIGDWPVPGDDGVLPDDSRRLANVRLLERRQGHHAIEIDGVRRAVRVVADGDTLHTSSRAGSLSWSRSPRFVDHGADEAGSGPVCPLPGTVIAVHVEVGQTVAAGDLLMVIEAMKMEHSITAANAAVVAAVHYAEGDRVNAGDLLVELAVIDQAAVDGAVDLP